MTNRATVAELFELAITAEKAAESVYRGFEARFARYPGVARFWDQYASDEASHAEWLERSRDASSAEQLAAEAAPRILHLARWVEGFSLTGVLGQIENLQGRL